MCTNEMDNPSTPVGYSSRDIERYTYSYRWPSLIASCIVCDVCCVCWDTGPGVVSSSRTDLQKSLQVDSSDSSLDHEWLGLPLTGVRAYVHEFWCGLVQKFNSDRVRVTKHNNACVRFFETQCIFVTSLFANCCGLLCIRTSLNNIMVVQFFCSGFTSCCLTSTCHVCMS